MPVGIQNDLAGKRFGKLHALSFEGRAKNYIALWKCRCDCGRELLVRGTNLANGNSTTCGCVHGVALSNPVTHEQLKQLATYEPLTGLFRARVEWRAHAAGAVLGCVDVESGYIQIVIGRTKYYGHILAWFYMKGAWPENQIDHRDRNRANNFWANLRSATQTQNNGNHPVRRDSQSRLKGVAFYPKKKYSWRASIRHKGKHRTLGYFADKAEAARAYDAAAKKVFGEFARTNFGQEPVSG